MATNKLNQRIHQIIIKLVKTKSTITDTNHMVTFPAAEHNRSFGRYQIILLGDRHTGVSSLHKATIQWCPDST